MIEGTSSLLDEGTGTYCVTSVTSQYRVDLDRRQVVRAPSGGASVIRPLNQAQTLERIEVCTVGQRARFHVRIDDQVVAQPLTTTVITAIERLNGEEPEEPTGAGVQWETRAGSGQLPAWGHLAVLGAVLHSGLSGEWLRLSTRARTATVSISTARGVPVELTRAGIVHRSVLLDIGTAMQAAHTWLTAPSPPPPAPAER